MIRRTSFVLAIFALSALASAVANASFVPLGVVDGLKVNGISADGSYLVGQYLDVNGDKIAMRWDITCFARCKHRRDSFFTRRFFSLTHKRSATALSR